MKANFYHLYRTNNDAAQFAVIVTATVVEVWRWTAGETTTTKLVEIPFLNPGARREATTTASGIARELARSPESDPHALLAQARTEDGRERAMRERAERLQDKAVRS